MTRKDYIAIADAIRTSAEDAETVEMFKSIITARIARVFMADNSRFDDARFRKAVYHNA